MAFGDPSWPEFDKAWERGEVGSHETISGQDALLGADRATMVAYAVEHCPVDPTFAPFRAWLDSLGVPVTIVSDGFGFYIGPILEAAGLYGVEVITNDQLWGPDGRPAGIRYGNGHPECVGCGTCKMQAVLRARARFGPLVFVGEGPSDQYAALYADLTFAKDVLVEHCQRYGVQFLPYGDFDDVRRALEDATALPGPVAPARCPGWMVP